MSTDTAIGIDVGGTKIAGAIVTAAGSIVEEEVVPTPRGPNGADPGGRATAKLVAHLVEAADRRGLRPLAIGVGVPEYVTRDGRISSAEVIDWPSYRPVVAGTGVPVVIESDVRCAALAELHGGAGRGRSADSTPPSSFLFVSVGTGISHSLVVEGRIWPGHRGEALALGELPVRPELAVRPDAPLTVEQQASGRALELAQAGPPIDEMAGHIMAEALAAVVRIVDPELIILGGGLGTSDGNYVNGLRSHYETLMRARPNPPPLLQSELSNRGGRIGAALAAMHRQPVDRPPGGPAVSG